MDKEIRADAKLKNLPPEILEDLWRYRNPEENGQKLTLEAILAELKIRYGITSSMGALSEFYAWLRMERRMAAARARAEQARLLLAQDPSATPEAIAHVGHLTFTSEMVQDGNVKAFVALEKLRLASRQLDFDGRRLKLLEDKAAEAKAMLLALTNNAKSKGGLTPETLAEIEHAAGLL